MLRQIWDEAGPILAPFYIPTLIVIACIAAIILASMFLPKLIYYILYHGCIVKKDDWLLVRDIRTHVKCGAYLVLELSDGDRCLFAEPYDRLCVEGDLLPVSVELNPKRDTATYYYGRKLILRRKEDINQEDLKVVVPKRIIDINIRGKRKVVNG
jgi:hypothetical protein